MIAELVSPSGNFGRVEQSKGQVIQPNELNNIAVAM